MFEIRQGVVCEGRGRCAGPATRKKAAKELKWLPRIEWSGIPECIWRVQRNELRGSGFNDWKAA
ncbi:MAG: hypothetical protein P1P88_14430 [Bacteroidales bacterium]|nr:hypothetical protein [Bacteroidales bacterium]